jgi:hypothetical protein
MSDGATDGTQPTRAGALHSTAAEANRGGGERLALWSAKLLRRIGAPSPE